MILVSGCSWACGEWQRGDLIDQSNELNADNPKSDNTIRVNKNILHGGLAEYISESGKEVVNLGIPSGSNLQVAQKILGWVERNPSIDIEKIFVFQTEYTRDTKHVFLEDYQRFTNLAEFANILIARFYTRLSEIAKTAKCPVYLIGGVSEIGQLDNITDHYPGLHIACQSMINLVINNNPNVSSPLLSWYTGDTVKFIEKIKTTMSTDDLKELLREINSGLEQENLVYGTPEYFWPDGSHPNRKAYKKLYDFLIAQKLL